jgi:hypothetical protein
MGKRIHRLVTLDEQDWWTVQRAAREKGLGCRGYSSALRLIIREWDYYQDPDRYLGDNPELELPRILRTE